MKHPPVQLPDDEAYLAVEEFIQGSCEEKQPGRSLRLHLPEVGAREGFRGIH